MYVGPCLYSCLTAAIAVHHGLGLEAASLAELEMCVRSGCAKDKIVFDSPAKTLDELSYALKLGRDEPAIS